MSNYPLLNYNWDFSGNQLPIANSTFAYGQLGQIAGSGVQGGIWGSLPVSTLFSNNNTLITISGNSLKFNVSGIYQITTILQFIPSSGFNSGIQTFVFSYSTSANTASSFSYSNNNINGPISFLDGSNNIILGTSPLLINGSASGGGSNSLSSTNYGGQIDLSTNVNSNIPFFILPNYSGSTIINNVNTITSIYYIPVGTTLYFNIGNGSTSTSNYINANGNFTVKLLKYILVPSVTSSNLTVSSLNYSNGYYYYTFVPTTTTSSGSATITFTGNVAMNYLLVGGGGGGGGSIYVLFGNSSYGGGGGGGQIVTSALTGNTFNINVGGGGTSVTGGNGNMGGNTTLQNGTAPLVYSYAGGGGAVNGGAGGSGGGGTGAIGGQGQSSTQNSTNGGAGQTITLSGINLSYSVGGAGGGGATSVSVYGGSGGSSATGGIAAGNGTSGSGGVGTGYGTGGGGGGTTNESNNIGGAGGPGLAVLYWAA